MSANKYPSCNVKGQGTLNKDLAFDIIDLSAERIRIKTQAPVQMKSKVRLDVSLDGGLFIIRIKSNGIVSKKIEKGYEIIFTDILNQDRTEINELMKSSCGIF